MNYIKKIEKKILVDGKLISVGINKYINDLCIDNFKTIKSIKDSIKLKTNIKKNIPIYINDEILLVQVSRCVNYDSFYFNYFNVVDIKVNNDYSVIFFKDKTYYRLEISRYRMNMLIYNIKSFIDYLNR